MKTRLVFLMIALVTLSISAQQPRRVRIGPGGPDATRDWPQPKIRAGLAPQQIADSVAAYAQSLSDAGHFSGVVLLAKDGRPLLTRAWGMADATSKAPNTTGTKFNIGSINKIFTKVAIAQLVQSGKLALDDRVRRHLPDFPSPAADRITIQQLLDHKSGLGDTFGPKYDSAPPSRLRELRDFLPLFVSEPLLFEPGTSQRYSNGGYIVLGLIIERLSGEKYRDYVRNHIFEPAGMKDTGFWATDEKVANRAVGYTRRGPDGPLPERRPNLATLPGRPSSAGGAFATAADLLRFTQSLAAGRLLSRKWTNWMFSDSFEGEVRPALGIAGGAPGVNAVVELNDGWTVITMSNYDPPSASVLAEGAMKVIRGRAEEAGEAGPVIRRRGPSAPARTEMSTAVTVPFTMTDHLVTVEAKVNGKGPFKFILDSGAGGVMRVSSKLAKTLALEQAGEALAGDPSGKNTVRRAVVRVDSVEIGGALFSGIDATIGDRPGPAEPDGVIGLALFSGLSATIDYPKSVLRLTSDALPENGEHIVSYTAEHGVPEIEIEVAGVPLRVHVDSGSPALLTVPSSWTAQLPLGEQRVVGRGRTTVNEFEIKAADLRGDVRVAGFVATSPRVDIVDMFPIGHIGSRFLRQYAVTFDVANRRMKLDG